MDESRVLLVRGHVGDGHVRQLEHNDISQALSERVVPSFVLPVLDGSVALAPAAVLEPGTTYGILSGDPPLGVDVFTAKDQPLPLLRRVWPPPEEAGGPFAIFCGEGDLPAPPRSLELSPGGVLASLQLGVFEGMGRFCLRLDLMPEDGGKAPDAPAFAVSPGLDSAGPVETDALIVPPQLTFDNGGSVLLDPAPILVAPQSLVPPPLAAKECAPEEISFGPGCARVADDRAMISTPDAKLFWVVRSGDGAEMAHVTTASEPFLLYGLPPGSSAELRVLAIDAFGRTYTEDLVVFTEPPMPHVIITEVLANPLGPEPDQEWIELYNDGLAAADLTGYSLHDLGGSTALPSVVLAPSAFALVVNDGFIQDDELDPAPAAGTELLFVSKLGKDGLKNDGEPLKLMSAEGQVLSRVPPSPKPKAGESIARTGPHAPDGAPSSFVTGAPTPGTF